MSYVTSNQPDGTPTWIDLGISDLAVARDFYAALFGWTYHRSSAATGYYTNCLLQGRPVAGLMPSSDTDAAGFWWNVYFATADCDATAARIVDAGGTMVRAPMSVGRKGRMALARDPGGAQFGLWQGGSHIGCQVVNEPNSLVRNDLVTPDPEPARTFYPAVFDYALERNEDLPGLDFTFLRRPDGHEVAGIFGSPDAAAARWATTFEVADTDAVVERATAAGGSAAAPVDIPYGRIATITDPFGVEFSVITRA